MVIELTVHIPPQVRYLHLTPVSINGREVGFIEEIIKHIDGDLFLCFIVLNKKSEEELSNITPDM